MSLVSGFPDHFLQGLAIAASAPAVVADGEIHCCAVGNGINGVCRAPGTAVGEEFHSDQLCLPSDTRHLFAIVRGCRNRSRNMRAVAVAIHWVVVLVAEIPPVYVIDEAVPVVILAVIRNFTRVFPDIALKVRVIVVDSGIDYGHYDGCGPFGDLPSLGSLDLRQGPLILPVGIVGSFRVAEDVIRLDVIDGRILGQTIGQVAQACVLVDFDKNQAKAREGSSGVPRFSCHAQRTFYAESTPELAYILEACLSCFEGDDQLIGSVLCGKRILGHAFSGKFPFFVKASLGFPCPFGSDFLQFESALGKTFQVVEHCSFACLLAGFHGYPHGFRIYPQLGRGQALTPQSEFERRLACVRGNGGRSFVFLAFLGVEFQIHQFGLSRFEFDLLKVRIECIGIDRQLRQGDRRIAGIAQLQGNFSGCADFYFAEIHVCGGD